jgi:hypothetical protein
MHHRATLRYTESLVTQAVRHYWRRTVGPGIFVAVALLCVFLIWRLSDGDRSWVVGVVAVVILLGAVMPLTVYVVHHRNSMARFKEMREPVAELLAKEDGFALSSDRGTTSLGWNAVKEIWRFDTLWLLLFSKAQFVTLPLEGLPEPMRQFILDRVTTSGGKVSP